MISLNLVLVLLFALPTCSLANFWTNWSLASNEPPNETELSAPPTAFNWSQFNWSQYTFNWSQLENRSDENWTALVRAHDKYLESEQKLQEMQVLFCFVCCFVAMLSMLLLLLLLLLLSCSIPGARQQSLSCHLAARLWPNHADHLPWRLPACRRHIRHCDAHDALLPLSVRTLFPAFLLCLSFFFFFFLFLPFSFGFAFDFGFDFGFGFGFGMGIGIYFGFLF
jgi:hypothetical protein